MEPLNSVFKGLSEQLDWRPRKSMEKSGRGIRRIQTVLEKTPRGRILAKKGEKSKVSHELK